MSIEAALYYDLTNTAAISAIIGTRAYPGIAPQGAALPRVTYQQIGNVHERHTAGGSSLAHPTMQIDCWAATQKGASDLAAAVQARLDNFTGTLGGGSTTASVDAAYLIDDRDDMEPEAEATGCAVYRRSMDFEIWYRE